MAALTTTPDCTPKTCGCKARTDEQALAGALFATGRAKDRDEAEQSAQAILWALREYGWAVVQDA